MRRKTRLSILAAVLLLTAGILLTSTSPLLAAKPKKSSAKSGPTEAGKAMLWEDRGDYSKLNLFYGIGSEEGAPKPPFTFVKEDVSGTNPKIKVTDANGVLWNVKFDEEVHAEIACSRIVWACGYMVEESYYVPSGTVLNVGSLGRAKKFVGSGNFTVAMFEKRPDNITRRGTPWSWDSNPFEGTKELSGLVTLALLLNNWDSKVDNNNVLGMFAEDGKTVLDWYIVADWGGSLGKIGGWLSHTKWDAAEYQKQPFLLAPSGGNLRFYKTGKDIGGAASHVSIEHAKWFSGIIGQLSEEQIKEAFRASGATEAEQASFAAKIMEKIGQLKQQAGN